MLLLLVKLYKMIWLIVVLMLVTKIRSAVKESKLFAILVDKTCDVSTRE